MGWARTLLLGDIGNRLDIADTERDIGTIRKKLARARRLNRARDQSIEQLQEENEQLQLCLASLIKTLERRGALTTEEVTQLVDMIDGDEEDSAEA